MANERNSIIVALGMGLLAGLLATLGLVLFSSSMAVAADESTTDLLPGVDLVTEEVEPGVYRVLGDGIRDLSGIGRARVRGHAAPDGLAIAPDGDVWVYALRSSATPELIRLGDPDSFPMPSTTSLDLLVGPDGTLWTNGWQTGLRRLGDDSWSEVAVPDGIGTNPWGVTPEGAVWTIGRHAYFPDLPSGTHASVARYDAEGWQDHPIDIGPDVREVLEGHDYDSGEYHDAAFLAPTIEQFGVDERGGVWAGLTLTGESWPAMALVRYDGEAWSLVDPLGVGAYYNMIPPRIGADGTLWVYLETGTIDTESDPDHHHLARLSDGRWTVFSGEDGVGQLLSRAESWGLLRVDHSGAVWVRPMAFPSDGIRVFDGTMWRQYLEDVAVDNMEVAPDGNVWVLAADHLYVITPEAVLAAE